MANLFCNVLVKFGKGAVEAERGAIRELAWKKSHATQQQHAKGYIYFNLKRTSTQIIVRTMIEIGKGKKLSHGSSEKLMFVREASGLVKPLGVWGTFIFTFSTLFHPFFWTLLAQLPSIFPGMGIVPGLLMGGVLQLVSYGIGTGMLIVTMPRAGANYVTISRSLHPLLGGVEGYRTIVWNTISAGVTAFFGGASIGLFLMQLGYFAKDAGLISIGNLISGSPINSMLIGILFVFVAFIFDWTGLKYLKYLMWANAVVAVSVVVMMMIGFTTVTPSTLPSVWDRAFGNGAYNEVIAVSNAHGFNPQAYSFNWSATSSSLLLSIFFVMLGGTYTIAGEVENPKKNILTSVAVSGVIVIAMVTTLGYLMMNSFGDVLLRYNYVYFGGHAGEYKVNPSVNPSVLFYGGVAIGNPLLAAYMAVPIAMSALNFMTTNFYWTTRPMFAMSMDRLLPETFTKVHPKYHTPSNAILFCLVVSLTTLILCVYVPYLLIFSASLYSLIFSLLLAMSQVALPFTRPEIYARGYTWSVAKFPVLTILGLWNTAFVFYALFASAAGVDALTWVLSAALIVMGMAGTAIAMQYRRLQGIEVMKVFASVPPD